MAELFVIFNEIFWIWIPTEKNELSFAKESLSYIFRFAKRFLRFPAKPHAPLGSSIL